MSRTASCSTAERWEAARRQADVRAECQWTQARLAIDGASTAALVFVGAGEWSAPVDEPNLIFIAWCGLLGATDGDAARFRVFADDALEFDSGWLTYFGARDNRNAPRPTPARALLRAARRLTLTVEARGDAQAAWISPGLSTAGVDAAPTATDGSADALCAKPPMGWNQWNSLGPRINEDVIMESLEAMVSSGLRDAGYEYFCLDDGWQDTDGRRWDAARFPGGMKALGRRVHELGMRFGMYSRPAWVKGDEEGAACDFADWGVDYLKYDFSDRDGEATNARMCDALRRTGRPIVMNVCEWGKNEPWLWGRRIGAQTWRVSYDVIERWDSPEDRNSGIGVLRAFDQTAPLACCSGPGGWCDPDMLAVGLNSASNVGSGSLTPTEARSHFSMWCLLAAPLLVGCDIRAMDAGTQAIVLNREAIRINQDALGAPVTLAKKLGDVEVWRRPLAGGDVAVALFNRGEAATDITARWDDLGIAGRRSALDVWGGTSTTEERVLTRSAASHEFKLLRLTPA